MRSLLAVSLVGCAQPSVECGPGTALEDGECVAPPLACGTGTHEEGGTCVADPVTFVIRSSKRVLADDTKPNEVFVFGFHPDGTPATDQIVLNTNRPNAGTFAPPTTTLTENGAVAAFTPCASTTPGCVGPLQLTVALAAAPTVPVSTFDLDLVDPPMVGSIAHCSDPVDTFYLEGSGYVYRGKLTVLDALFAPSGGTQRAVVEIAPLDPIQGKKWTFEISTVPLAMPLVPGVYLNARQGAVTDSPALSVGGMTPFAYCPYAVQGEFQVHDYTFTTTIEHMTVSFRQWCSAYPTKVLSGCVHIE